MTISTTAEILFEKLKHVDSAGPHCRYTVERCESLAPVVDEIIELKKQMNAVILAHSYLTPDILYGVADFVGDSYQLSIDAQTTQADLIVFAAVDFMAETAKVLNPEKVVVAPNRNGGCSLAESITADQVNDLREQFPDYTFVCYINTTAAVKAFCDVTVTSSNVYEIIENIENENIYFLPDGLMAQNVKKSLLERGLNKNIRWWDGNCYVHMEYRADDVVQIRHRYPQVRVLAHPECHPEVINQADFVGSTSGLLQDIKSSDADAFLLLTECGLTSRLQVEAPDKKFVGSCSLCKYMKSNSIFDIRDALQKPYDYEVSLDADIQEKALATLKEMYRLTGRQ